LAGMSLLFHSCEKNKKISITPSDNITTRLESFTDYEGLEIDNAFHVQVSFSESEEPIEITANENLHGYIIIEKVKDVLWIRLQDNLNVIGQATLRVNLTAKEITEFGVRGASVIELKDNIIEEFVAIGLTGASAFYGQVNATLLRAGVSGASQLNVSG
ncbi:MAG: DUF2807 domain-containing protein, partial [Bacteroidales bacterium]|nr:DUF2807 domain-containing protein [Bacteroidales bacterium]